MIKPIRLFILLILCTKSLFAAVDNVAMSVWANEAIVATYTFNASNFLERQKAIAKYFTTEAWIAYSKALQSSKLPETVKEHQFEVSSVATLPPTIQALDDKHWKVSMPLLVFYKGPDLSQKQELLINLTMVEAPGGQGVRGFAIASFQSEVGKPPCQCKKDA